MKSEAFVVEYTQALFVGEGGDFIQPTHGIVRKKPDGVQEPLHKNIIAHNTANNNQSNIMPGHFQ